MSFSWPINMCIEIRRLQWSDIKSTTFYKVTVRSELALVISPHHNRLQTVLAVCMLSTFRSVSTQSQFSPGSSTFCGVQSREIPLSFTPFISLSMETTCPEIVQTHHRLSTWIEFIIVFIFILKFYFNTIGTAILVKHRK